MKDINLKNSPLGKDTTYITTYDPELLFAIARAHNREQIGINEDALPFYGNDVWNAYEVSWLNEKGKPMVAFAEIIVPCESPNIVESKSIKLYLVSFNNSKFSSQDEVEHIIATDLSVKAGAPVQVKLMALECTPTEIKKQFDGVCLDKLDITCNTYLTQPNFLHTENMNVAETVFSDLLRSNCPITGQPDWGSVQIAYTGKKINHEGLLKYIVSLRNHDEFHEQCVERMFMDIMKHCMPEKLLVYARYTRRGGLDINPYRANYGILLKNIRLFRQ